MTATTTPASSNGHAKTTARKLAAAARVGAEPATSAPAANRHLPGLADAVCVQTPAFRKTQALAAQAVGLREMAAFIGDPGLGKTFAVDHFVRSQPLEWVWLDMGPTPRPKEVVVRLLRALAGGCDSRDPIYDLMDDLIPVLAATPRIIVIDEAQNLDTKGLNQIRQLHDHHAADFALFLLGGAGCEAKLKSARELASRVSSWVHFKPLEGEDLFGALSAWHPLFARSDHRLLARIDEKYAKGNMRNWARMLQKCIPLAAAAGVDRVTVPLAKAALAGTR